MNIPLPYYAPFDALPGIELNELIDYLFLFFLSSIRLSAFLLSSPFLGSRNVPTQAKIVFAMILSFFNFLLMPEINITPEFMDNLVAIIAVEAIIGISLGLTLTIWFSAASMAGNQIATAAGLGFSSLVNPETGGQTPVISIVFDLFLLTIFVSLNGHLIAIDFIIKSNEILELGSRLPSAALIGAGIEATGAMFYAAGLIMLPVVGTLMIVNVAVGVITKSAPQLNLFSFGFPIILLVTFVILFSASRSIGGAFAELTNNALSTIELVIGAI